MEANKAVFSATREISVPVPNGNEIKKVIVSFPSDEDWSAYVRRSKFLTRDLGRGQSETTTPDKKAAGLAMLGKIQKNADAVTLDEDEAAAVISRLEQCKVTGCEPNGQTFIVSMMVPGGTVNHELKRPTQKQAANLEEFGATARRGRYGTETVVHLHVGASLYDELHVSHDGYEASVPNLHKNAAAHAVLTQFQEITFEDDQDFSSVSGPMSLPSATSPTGI